MAVHRLANELARHPEDQVTVFSLTQKPPADAAYQHEQLFPGAPWLRTNRIARLFLLPFLLNQVRFDAFDVLHLHGDDWFFLRRKVPSLRTLHGSALEEARSATSLKRRLSQYCVYPLEHLSAWQATVAMAIGPKTAALYQTPHVANNGVDLSLFHPGQKSEAPSALFVGTWEGRKRGQFLFETFTREVLPSVPDAHLYMVCDFCPTHESVTHVERPSDEALARLYRRAWVFAYPSVYEGFGIPYIEAMASSTAVLSSPNDGAAYVLNDGTYGVVAEDAAFGNQLARLLTDAGARRRLEKKGLPRAEEFSWSAVAMRHRRLYEKAIARWESSVSQGTGA